MSSLKRRPEHIYAGTRAASREHPPQDARVAHHPAAAPTARRSWIQLEHADPLSPTQKARSNRSHSFFFFARSRDQGRRGTPSRRLDRQTTRKAEAGAVGGVTWTTRRRRCTRRLRIAESTKHNVVWAARTTATSRYARRRQNGRTSSKLTGLPKNAWVAT